MGSITMFLGVSHGVWVVHIGRTVNSSCPSSFRMDLRTFELGRRLFYGTRYALLPPFNMLCSLILFIGKLCGYLGILNFAFNRLRSVTSSLAVCDFLW